MLEVREPEREPQARRVGERLERLFEPDDGGGGRVGVRQQHAVGEAILLRLRVALNRQAHRRDRVLQVPALLVDLGEQRVDRRRRRARARPPPSSVRPAAGMSLRARWTRASCTTASAFDGSSSTAAVNSASASCKQSGLQ